MADASIYTVGGTVQTNRQGIYIRRLADEELLALCREGKFAYVLTPRQMGKSSLMVRTAFQLRTEGIQSAMIDLTGIGTQVKNAEQWYLGLLIQIEAQLMLDGYRGDGVLFGISGVNSVVFSPDGLMIASDSSDNTVRLWNLSGQLLHTLKGHSGQGVKIVVFSPDGLMIASGGTDNTVKLWNLSGQLLHTLEGHSGDGVVFSPDGQTIATGSNDTVKLWNLSGQELHTLNGHSGSVNSVVFSPDGQMIATGSSDNTVKLWNLSGQLLDTLEGHGDRVNSVVFSPDGKTIASSSYEVKLWNLNLDDLLKRGCDWIYDYLENNPSVNKDDRHLCDDVAKRK
ncbi:MAG: AAA-like domain-containing protein [Rhizonema sp. PD38]|nr:AAA-like domain-containing protein [Rhizonema sp. PD38]